MRTLIPALVLGLSVAVAASPAAAQELVEPSTEVKFEKSPVIDGKPFLCLGTGVRKKAIFKVYAIVYCVEEAAGQAEIQKYFAEGAGKAHAPSQGKQLAEKLADDPGFFRALMAMKIEKAAQLVFVRDVGKDKMKEAFEESLTRSLGKDEKPRIESFVNLLDRDLKRGDRMILQTGPDGRIRVGHSGEPKSVQDPVLAAAVWQPYLGEDSVAPSLRKSVAATVAAMRP